MGMNRQHAKSESCRSEESHMKKIVVTGGSGKLGTRLVKDLLEYGYDVLNVDTKAPAEKTSEFAYADLKNLGEVYGVLQGADAVIHLAAIPTAFLYQNEVTFQNNVISTYHVLEAMAGLKIGKAVHVSIHDFRRKTRRCPADRIGDNLLHFLLPIGRE